MKNVKKRSQYLLLILLGALLTSFSAPGWNIFPLAWFSFIPFLYLLQQIKTAKSALKWGALAGLVINMHAFIWLNHTIVVFGHLPQIVALLLYMLLALFQGLRYGFAFYAYKKWKMDQKPVWYFPLFFATLEYFMPMLFTWHLGHTQHLFIPFIQITDLFGVSFLGFVMVFFGTALYRSNLFQFKTKKISWREPICAIALIAICITYGMIQTNRYDQKMTSAQKIKIGMVQPNIDMLWRSKGIDPTVFLQRTLDDFKEASIPLVKSGAELIVWPESSYKSGLNGDRKELKNYVPPIGAPLIFGGASYRVKEGKTIWQNTAFYLDKELTILDQYHKHYLLAFGEYIPFGEHFPSITKKFPEIGNFRPGDEVKVFDFKGVRLGMMTCYEDIVESFSNKIAKKKPQIMINITNDGWFGKTDAPDLHKMLTVFRSIENRLFLLRITNTGRTAVIDANGRLVKEFPLFVKATGIYDVPVMGERTIYSKGGWMAPYGYLLFLILYGLYHRKKRGQNNTL